MAAITPTFRIDFSEWNKAFPAYMKTTSRALPDVLNKKAYYVVRRAMWYTPVTPGQVIKTSLGTIRRSKGQIVSQKITAGRSGAPLAALIVQSIRAKRGEKGLYGSEMKQAIAQFITSRARSSAFIKSGWLPAVKTLSHSFSGSRGGLPPMGAVRQFGAPHGSANPAKSGMKCLVTIENAADLDSFRAKYHVPTHHPDALLKFGGPALQKAFNEEAKSMLEEVARRQFEEAKKLGIQVMGL